MQLYPGYSQRQFNNKFLRVTAQALAEQLPAIMHETGADCIAVTGKSGISMAFAVSMLLDVPIMVVRKRGESTHGSPIEGTEGHTVQRYLILDDFVASGETVARLVADVRDASTFGDVEPAECVGFVEYAIPAYDPGKGRTSSISGSIKGYQVRSYLDD